MFRRTSLARPRGRRHPLGVRPIHGLLPPTTLCLVQMVCFALVLALVAGERPAQADIFGARGPAAQDPVLADSGEVFIVAEKPSTVQTDRWSAETWDCPDALGNAAGIKEDCRLTGPDLAENPIDSEFETFFIAQLPHTQVASVAGRFRPSPSGASLSEVAFALAGPIFTGQGTAGVELRLCDDLNGASPCSAAVFLGNFAPQANVDIFGANAGSHRRLLQMTAAQLDDDPLDELVVAWWDDHFRIAILVFDWDPQTGVRSAFFAPALDLPDLPTSLERSATFGLDAVDFDGDLIQTIAVVAPNQLVAPAQANDFDNFQVSFFEFVRNTGACGGPARCLLARGQDSFEEHHFAGGDHLGLYYPAGQGRGQGCSPSAPDRCHLEKVVVQSARLTAAANGAAALTSGLAESLVVVLRYSYENGDGGNFREQTTDLVLLNPERDAGGLNVELGQFIGCSPSGGGSAFANEKLCLDADPADPSQGVNAVLHHRELFYFKEPVFFPTYGGVCIAAGNLAGSALDEIALFRQGLVTLFEIQLDGAGKPAELVELRTSGLGGLGGGFSFVQEDCDIAIMDMDADLMDPSDVLESWDREIVVSRMVSFMVLAQAGGFITLPTPIVSRQISVLKVFLDSNADFSSLGLHAATVERTFALGAAFEPHIPLPAFASSFPDADNDRVSLGAPKVILDRTVDQPTLLLSAPPRHLAAIDEFSTDECYAPGEAFDINWTMCLKPIVEDCHGLESFYKKTASNNYTSEIANEVTRSLGGGFSFAGFGAKVKRTYKDTSIVGNASTQKVDKEESAFFEDQVQVRSTEYRVYEYPVLQGSGPIPGPSGKPLTVLITRTVPAKVTGDTAEAFDLVLPTHVPGNLLSYKPLSWFQDPARCGSSSASCRIGDVGTSFDVDFSQSTVGVSDGSWQIGTQTTAGQSATSQGSLALSVGASGTFKGITVSVEGDYETVKTKSLSNTVTSETGLGWNFMDRSSTDPAFRYRATPIVMIDEIGQLTLDFAVDVIPDSCLDIVYGRSGRSDPALALPLRRIEGAQTVSNEQKDLETKEIGCRFDPTTGMFELATRVHNYSLLDTGSSVAVDFFVGDPRDVESFHVGGTATSSIPPQNTLSGDNEEDVSISVDAGCDGTGSVAEGDPCVADSDCRVPGDVGGACVPMLASPYDVCGTGSGVFEGERCSADPDCRTGPTDLSGICAPETRLFVQLDPNDVIAEVSEDNNIGWAKLDSNCTPVTVPEPSRGVLTLCALGALIGLRHRRFRIGSSASEQLMGLVPGSDFARTTRRPIESFEALKGCLRVDLQSLHRP